MLTMSNAVPCTELCVPTPTHPRMIAIFMFCPQFRQLPGRNLRNGKLHGAYPCRQFPPQRNACEYWGANTSFESCLVKLFRSS